MVITSHWIEIKTAIFGSKCHYTNVYLCCCYIITVSLYKSVRSFRAVAWTGVRCKLKLLRLEYTTTRVADPDGFNPDPSLEKKNPDPEPNTGSGSNLWKSTPIRNRPKKNTFSHYKVIIGTKIFVSGSLGKDHYDYCDLFAVLFYKHWTGLTFCIYILHIILYNGLV